MKLVMKTLWQLLMKKESKENLKKIIRITKDQENKKIDTD